MNLRDSNPLTTNGIYSLTGIIPGRKYLCCMKGNYGGGTINLSYPDPINGATRTIVGTESGYTDSNTEFDFVLPATELTFTLTGATAPSISITITPYH